jgi:hypothetical protein
MAQVVASQLNLVGARGIEPPGHHLSFISACILKGELRGTELIHHFRQAQHGFSRCSVPGEFPKEQSTDDPKSLD